MNDAPLKDSPGELPARRWMTLFLIFVSMKAR